MDILPMNDGLIIASIGTIENGNRVIDEGHRPFRSMLASPQAAGRMRVTR